ncbi:GDP-mannose 4,6-dehydratase [bacterium]|nr:GDP-mannose 4,6-dehydratase [bacterium]
MKKALITGITGQDGSYLADFLLSKGYEVHGIIRYSASNNLSRIKHLIDEDEPANSKITLHFGDLTDSSSLIKIINEVKPDELYNLGAQSHVNVSFKMPEYTTDADALGTLRLLEAIRTLGLEKTVRFYQASTSELYGTTKITPQNEDTPFCPTSPYACAKLFSYWIVKIYREAYGMFCSNGILFNHESPRRGEKFVTKKITKAAARIKTGLQDKLYIGNLDSSRDWGYTPDYVEGMWQILQLDTPGEYVLATGKNTTLRDFCKKVFEQVGIEIEFEGSGLDEKGIDKNTGRVLIEVDKKYYRPIDVTLLHGDSTKAIKEFNWSPKHTAEDLIKIMLDSDLKEAEQELRLKKTLIN